MESPSPTPIHETNQGRNSNRLLSEFEPAVLANLKPVVGMAKLGTEPTLDTTLGLLQNALAEYVVVPYELPPEIAMATPVSPEINSPPALTGNAAASPVPPLTTKSITTTTTCSSSSSKRSKARLHESWVQKYLTTPSIIIVLAIITEGEGQEGEKDAPLSNQLRTLNNINQQKMQRIVVILQASRDMMGGIEGRVGERRERLAKATGISQSAFFTLLRDPAHQGFSGVLEYVADNWDKFYKERIKLYKKKLVTAETDIATDHGNDSITETSLVSPYPCSGSLENSATKAVAIGLRYRFKIAIMEVFLSESMNALSSFNNAYSSVIRHYEKLGMNTVTNAPSRSQIMTSTSAFSSSSSTFSQSLSFPLEQQRIAFLESVRWTCDVIALRMVMLLIVKGQKASADAYIAGHLQWFAASHGNPWDLCQWKGRFFAAIIKILPTKAAAFTRGDSFHRGYYQYLAAKNAISLITHHHSLEGGMVPLADVELVLDYLVQAYEQYMGRNYRHMTLLIGRLIVSQYLLLHNYSQARELLVRLRTAHRTEGWKQIRADVLRELLDLCEQSKTPLDRSLAIECYWELASLFPAQVMDEFDVRLGQLFDNLEHQRITGEGGDIIIDMSVLERGLIQAAVRLEPPRELVDNPIHLTVDLCNMTPLMISVKSVICCLRKVTMTEGSEPNMDKVDEKNKGNIENEINVNGLDRPGEKPRFETNGTDLLPGTFIELNSSFEGCQSHGSFTIHSLVIQLSEYPIKLIFPASTLYTFEQLDTFPGDAITTNWSFLQALTPFTVEAQQVTLLPLQPIIHLELLQTGLLVPGHPGAVLVKAKNENRHYSIECNLSFNGNFNENLFVVNLSPYDETYYNSSLTNPLWMNQLTKLADYQQQWELAPGEERQLKIFLLYTTSFTMISRPKMTLHLDCQSRFSLTGVYSNDLATSSYATINDMTHRGVDLVVEVVESFRLATDYQAKATDAALALEYSPKATQQAGLVYYEANVTVQARLPCVQIQTAQLLLFIAEGNDNSPLIIQTIQLPGSCLLMEGEERLFQFQIHRMTGIEATSYPLRLRLLCHLPDDPYPFLQYETDLPAVSLRSRSIFTLALPLVDARVGYPIEHEWRIWNQDELDHNLLLRLDPGEDFVYMGPRQVRRRIAGGNEDNNLIQLRGWLIPLKAGPGKMPTLIIKSAHPGQTIFAETLSLAAPFVLPL